VKTNKKKKKKERPGAHPSFSTEGTDFLSPRRGGENLTHLAPKLKKEWSYNYATFGPSSLFWGENCLSYSSMTMSRTV
jgi:hypothetical protein